MTNATRSPHIVHIRNCVRKDFLVSTGRGYSHGDCDAVMDCSSFVSTGIAETFELRLVVLNVMGGGGGGGGGDASAPPHANALTLGANAKRILV